MKNENFGFSSGNVSRESLKNNRGPILSGLLREINISRIGWSFLELFYCLIGVGAAFVSFVIEKDVFFPHYTAKRLFLLDCTDPGIC